MLTSLFEQLTPRCVVLTPSHRLAAFIQREYDLYQYQKGLVSWETLPIYTFEHWICKCWEAEVRAGTVGPTAILNPHQLQILWENAIQHTGNSVELLHLTATAATAHRAWELAQQWQIELHAHTFSINEDTQTWWQWAKQVERTLTVNHWLDPCMVGNKLIYQLQHYPTAIPLPSKILCVGFNHFSPQEKSLLSVLAKLNCQHKTISLHQTPGRVAKIALLDNETELRHMALWAKQQPPSETVCCVVPQLKELRSQVEDIFNEYFGHDEKFNISLGRPLRDYPLINHALCALNLLKSNTSFFEFSTILRSPFFLGSDTERSLRASLDAKLRKNREPQIVFAKLLEEIKSDGSCPQLIETLSKYHQDSCRHLAEESKTPFQWAHLFQEQLLALGWPGERILNSEEYQLHHRWQLLLEEFSSLGLVTPALTLSHALQKLHEMTQGIIFQAKSPPGVKIHILGLLDTQGLLFDNLWIMGLHDGVWPRPVTPNPFLPLSLQRQLALPHASAEEELTFSQVVTSQLLRAAKNIILSYPQQQADTELRQSSLIQFVPEIKVSELNISLGQTAIEKMLATASLEEVDDDYGPIFEAETEHTHSSAIFKEQAACPFRAFVKLRLGGQALHKPQFGLSALLRGKIVHEALEKIWQTIKSLDNLNKYNEQDLQKLINESIASTLFKIKATYDLPWHEKLFNLEQQRLAKLITHWLHIEHARAPFTVIATEQKVDVTFGNIPLKLRIDRIDQLDNGSYIILDYKNSLCSKNDWFGARPDEPQLPLYCVVSAIPVSAIAYAQLRSDDIRFKGISLQKEILPGVEVTHHFADQIVSWKNTLHDLADQFLKGYAKIDPKEPQTCERCDLQMVCRIHELAAK